MKYTLKTYGWSVEIVGKTITDEQLKQIKTFMDENDYSSYSECRFELEDIVGDIWDGDLFHVNKAFDNGTMMFVVEDELGKEILKFDILDVTNGYDMFEDFEERFPSNGYDGYPSEEGPKNVWISSDENKGGIYHFEFESEEIPTIDDFTYTTTSVDTPDGDFDLINDIIFKGEILDILDFLDSSGKTSDLQIFTLGE